MDETGVRALRRMPEFIGRAMNSREFRGHVRAWAGQGPVGRKSVNKFAVRMLSLLTRAVRPLCHLLTGDLYISCGGRIVAILTTRFILHLQGMSPDLHSLVFPGISSSRFLESNVESLVFEGRSVVQCVDGQNSS